MITLTCPSCQQNFNPYRDNPKAVCCSRSCSNTYRARNAAHPLCAACGAIVFRPGKHRHDKAFCDKVCEALFRNQKKEKPCETCGDVMLVTPTYFAKRRFCGQKCAGIGNKLAMTTRKPQWRSYGECALVVLFRRNFPDLELITNERKTLGGFELDIFFPTLKAAVEFNGPHHFKPVYGPEMLAKTQRRDKEKRARALSQGIRIVEADCLKSISWTSKTIVYDLFSRACNELELAPALLCFTPEEVFAEKGKTPANYKPYIPVN